MEVQTQAKILFFYVFPNGIVGDSFETALCPTSQINK